MNSLRKDPAGTMLAPQALASTSVKASPVFSLVITSQNRKDDLLRTLAAMRPKLFPEHEIVVFDNGSVDGTAAAVASEFPEVTLVAQSPGLAFTAARNRLMTLARGDYALSLDDDSEVVTADFARIVLDYFEEHPRCAVISFPVYWGKDLPACKPEGEQPRRVQSFVGCGHVWRMEAWRSIPEYPEWFEFYGEEAFASLSLLKRGWEVHYFPDVLVHHRVDLSKRSADRAQRIWRYRRHLRASIFVMLLFYPASALPRRLAYVVWTQIKLRLLNAREFAMVSSLFWVLCEVMKTASLVRRTRQPMTKEEWTLWNRLAPGVIYWAPGKSEPVPVSADSQRQFESR